MSLAHAEPYGDLELSLGDRFALARRRAGLDQQDMAERIGVSRPLVSKWERNKSLPDVMQAAAWADITGTSYGWLCGVPVRNRCFSVVDTEGVQGVLPFEGTHTARGVLAAVGG